MTNNTRAALLILSILPVTEAQECGKGEQDIVQYDLPGCPDPAFRLPDSVNAAPYRLSPPIRTSLPQQRDCSAFKMYDFWADTKLRLGVGFRVNRGQSCSLEAAYNTLRSNFWESQQWADIAARLVMHGVVSPKLPMVRVERFQKPTEFYARCAGGAEHASR